MENERNYPNGRKVGKDRNATALDSPAYIMAQKNTAVSENADNVNSDENAVNLAKREVLIRNTISLVGEHGNLPNGINQVAAISHALSAQVFVGEIYAVLIGV